MCPCTAPRNWACRSRRVQRCSSLIDPARGGRMAAAWLPCARAVPASPAPAARAAPRFDPAGATPGGPPRASRPRYEAYGGPTAGPRGMSPDDPDVSGTEGCQARLGPTNPRETIRAALPCRRLAAPASLVGIVNLTVAFPAMTWLRVRHRNQPLPAGSHAKHTIGEDCWLLQAAL